MARPISENLKLSESLRSTLREVLRTNSVDSLVRQGYTYSQIAENLSALIGGGLVVETDGKLSITEQGKAALFRDSDSQHGFVWLEPREDARVAKVGLMEPYIPERRSLQKIRRRTSS